MFTSQVCCVGGHHDKGKEPPHNGYSSCGEGSEDKQNYYWIINKE